MKSTAIRKAASGFTSQKWRDTRTGEVVEQVPIMQLRFYEQVDADAVSEKVTDAQKIARLNDSLRRSFRGGRVMLTQCVQALDQAAQSELMQAVRTFDDFTNANDPHKEHDYGRVEVDGSNYCWKIDYYDNQLSMGSEDPTNPKVTTRVLTIMDTSEY